MSWTYTGNDPLARAATALFVNRSQPCRVSPLVFMSDPERTPEVLGFACTLPKGAALIYRHFGAGDREEVARDLRDIATKCRLQFLIGQDVKLAKDVGADGVHLPQRDITQAAKIRTEMPKWIITAAAHDEGALEQCAAYGVDAAFVSSVFASASKSAGEALGVARFAGLVAKAKLPVFALGGINAHTAPKLLDSDASGLAAVSGFLRNLPCVLQVEHSAAMAELHATSFSPSWPQSDFVRHIEAKTDDVLGVAQNQTLSGFIITRVIADQAEILTVCVDSAARGQGLGAELLVGAERAAKTRGADIMFLEVAQDNAAAIALYQRAGYVQCGRRPGYYRREKAGKIGRVDAILYQKHLA